MATGQDGPRGPLPPLCNRAGTAMLDPNTYLYMFKESQYRNEFKIHSTILFLDKNVDYMFRKECRKCLLSLGYDERVD